MSDVKIAAIVRSKLRAFKIAAGPSAVDAGKWADEHLQDAVARVRISPNGTDPFVELVDWMSNLG